MQPNNCPAHQVLKSPRHAQLLAFPKYPKTYRSPFINTVYAISDILQPASYKYPIHNGSIAANFLGSTLALTRSTTV